MYVYDTACAPFEYAKEVIALENMVRYQYHRADPQTSIEALTS
jgi:hypothetical protein